MDACTRVTFIAILLTMYATAESAQSDWWPSLKAAFQQAKSLDVMLLIKEPGEATRTCRITLSRPAKFLIKEPQLHVRSNGSIIEWLDTSETVTKSVVSDVAGIRRAFDRDYLRIWSLFVQPDALDSLVAKSLEPEPRGSTLFGVLALKDPTRTGFELRAIIEPEDRLPREIHIWKPGFDITKAIVSEIKINPAVTDELFGKSAVQTKDVERSREVRVAQFPWEDLLALSSSRVFPSGTHVLLSGAFPREFSKIGGRTCTLTLLVDGNVQGQVDAVDNWQMKWIPEPGKLGSFNLKLEGKQGNQKINIGECTVEVRSDWPWNIKEASLDDSGAAVLILNEPLAEKTTKVQVTWNGSATTTFIRDGAIFVRSEQLVPGRVNLRGSLQRADGSVFELMPRVITLDSRIVCNLPSNDLLTVNRTTLEQLIKIGVTFRKPFNATQWIAWCNGFAVARGAYSGNNIDLPVESVFDGKNDLIFELKSPSASMFSAPVEIQAKVDVDVQRLRVSEILLATIKQPIRETALYLAQAAKMLPDTDEVTEGLLGMQRLRPGQWAATAEAISKISDMAPHRPPATTDLSFNERAKEVSNVAMGIMSSSAKFAGKLSVGFGEGGLVSKSRNLLLTLDDMVAALKSANGSMDSATRQLKILGKFLKDFPPRKPGGLELEQSLVTHMASDAPLLYYPLLFLQDVRNLVAGHDNYQALDMLNRTMFNLRGDAPFRTRFIRVIELLREVIGWKDQVAKLLRQISDLEGALARASSSEERHVIAGKIAEIRITISKIMRQIRDQQYEAWLRIGDMAADLGINFSGVADVAPK